MPLKKWIKSKVQAVRQRVGGEPQRQRWQFGSYVKQPSHHTVRNRKSVLGLLQRAQELRDSGKDDWLESDSDGDDAEAGGPRPNSPFFNDVSRSCVDFRDVIDDRNNNAARSCVDFREIFNSQEEAIKDCDLDIVTPREDEERNIAINNSLFAELTKAKSTEELQVLQTLQQRGGNPNFLREILEKGKQYYYSPESLPGSSSSSLVNTCEEVDTVTPAGAHSDVTRPDTPGGARSDVTPPRASSPLPTRSLTLEDLRPESPVESIVGSDVTDPADPGHTVSGPSPTRDVTVPRRIDPDPCFIDSPARNVSSEGPAATDAADLELSLLQPAHRLAADPPSPVTIATSTPGGVSAFDLLRAAADKVSGKDTARPADGGSVSMVTSVNSGGAEWSSMPGEGRCGDVTQEASQSTGGEGHKRAHRKHKHGTHRRHRHSAEEAVAGNLVDMAGNLAGKTEDARETRAEPRGVINTATLQIDTSSQSGAVTSRRGSVGADTGAVLAEQTDGQRGEKHRRRKKRRPHRHRRGEREAGSSEEEGDSMKKDVMAKTKKFQRHKVDTLDNTAVSHNTSSPVMSLAGHAPAVTTGVAGDVTGGDASATNINRPTMVRLDRTLSTRTTNLLKKYLPKENKSVLSARHNSGQQGHEPTETTADAGKYAACNTPQQAVPGCDVTRGDGDISQGRKPAVSSPPPVRPPRRQRRATQGDSTDPRAAEAPVTSSRVELRRPARRRSARAQTDIPRTPRTIAILSNPAVRKHLTRALGSIRPADVTGPDVTPPTLSPLTAPLKQSLSALGFDLHRSHTRRGRTDSEPAEVTSSKVKVGRLFIPTFSQYKRMRQEALRASCGATIGHISEESDDLQDTRSNPRSKSVGSRLCDSVESEVSRSADVGDTLFRHSVGDWRITDDDVFILNLDPEGTLPFTVNQSDTREAAVTCTRLPMHSQSEGNLMNRHSTELSLPLRDNPASQVVTRSRSDLSERGHVKAELEARYQTSRSDPLNDKPPPAPSQGLSRPPSRKSRGCVSKEEILSFLQGQKSSGIGSLPSESGGSMRSLTSGVTSYDDQDYYNTDEDLALGRADSGYGVPIEDALLSAGVTCIDCNSRVRDSALCRVCRARRTERRETIQEILSSERSYGKDLAVIKEEFWEPMSSNGLLNRDQLKAIFLNIDELIRINQHFISQLEHAISDAKRKEDVDLQEVYIGQMFLESTHILLAFEAYCVDQSAAASLLEGLEREREVLRVFLEVAQLENERLRRMNIQSFHMAPIQRIMKYPLLLNRLHNATSQYHPDKEAIKRARVKIDNILEHINAKAKGGSLTKRLRRRWSSLSQIKRAEEAETIEVEKVALEALGWNRNDMTLVMTSRLQMTVPGESVWPRRRSIKFTTVHGLLISKGKAAHVWISRDDRPLFARTRAGAQLKDAALVLVKERNGKHAILREPLYLGHCLVYQDMHYKEELEVQEINKDPIVLKGEDHHSTQTWFQCLKFYSLALGTWRKRRNALANIMLQDK